MDSPPKAVEIKSALWQKILALIVAGICWCGGVMCLILPFFPSLSTPANSPLIASKPLDFLLSALLGSICLGAGFLIWWPVHKYSIRADEGGITQTNGLFHQSLRWADVAAYYLALNRRQNSNSPAYIEPFLLDKDGNIIFQSFAHLLVSSENGLKRRKEFWQFVESQLAGKKIETPPRQFTPCELAVKSLDFDPSQKSRGWKIWRLLALALYGLFWFGLGFGPLYYFVVMEGKQPPDWAPILLLVSFTGPLIPHLIWIQWKKRKIIKFAKQKNSTP